MSGKKILMLVGEFTEEYEIFVYQQAMEAVGHTVHVVCPDKKAGDRIKTSLHDFEGDQTYTEKLGHFFTINKTFSEAEKQLNEYDAVYCAGGRGPEYIRTDKRIQAMVRHFHEAKKPIFTICHGVQILVAVDGVVRGKKVGALGACEPEVTLAGGTYIDLSATEAYVDGTMVSVAVATSSAGFIVKVTIAGIAGFPRWRRLGARLGAKTGSVPPAAFTLTVRFGRFLDPDQFYQLVFPARAGIHPAADAASASTT